MKASEVIDFLTSAVEHHGDFAVDINDGNGTYKSIERIGMQHWTDNEGRYHLVAEIFPSSSSDKDESVRI